MGQTVPQSGYKSSEFFALFCAHALVLLAGKMGLAVPPDAVSYLLALDAGYITTRPALKGITTYANAKVESAKVAVPNTKAIAAEVLSQLKEKTS